jgi:hypothetical protein
MTSRGRVKGSARVPRDSACIERRLRRIDRSRRRSSSSMLGLVAQRTLSLSDQVNESEVTA